MNLQWDTITSVVNSNIEFHCFHIWIYIYGIRISIEHITTSPFQQFETTQKRILCFKSKYEADSDIYMTNIYIHMCCIYQKDQQQKVYTQIEYVWKALNFIIPRLILDDYNISDGSLIGAAPCAYIYHRHTHTHIRKYRLIHDT